MKLMCLFYEQIHIFRICPPKNVLMRVHEQRKFDTAILGMRRKALQPWGGHYHVTQFSSFLPDESIHYADPKAELIRSVLAA